MLHSISCKNFYSIGEEICIDFTVNDKTPDNLGYFKTKASARLSKVEVVIGPNASGKTNLLKVIPFIKWLIIDALKSPNKTPGMSFQPFISKSYIDKVTEISVVFEIEGDIYYHFFALNRERILSEILKVKNKVNKRNTYKTIFSRTWLDKDIKYQFDDKLFDLPKGFEKIAPSQASIIALTKDLDHKKSRLIADYWSKVKTNVGEEGYIGENLANAFMYFNENKVIKEEAENLLKNFDLGLKGFQIQTHDDGLNVEGLHTFGEETILLPLKYESAGTKKLFVLLKNILQVLKNGGLAILDEFDSNLHPEMTVALLELFMQPQTNPYNAQLLFSTHSHIILNKLDKYQIILTEKNSNGETECWRLDEINDVRPDDNYYNKYLAGAYGAVPNLTNS